MVNDVDEILKTLAMAAFGVALVWATSCLVYV